MGKMNWKDAELIDIQQNLVDSRFFDDPLIPLNEVLEDMCSDNGIVRNSAIDYFKAIYKGVSIKE